MGVLSVGVVGGGTMGLGIAYVCLFNGVSVHLVEPHDARRAGLAQALRVAAQSGIERGKFNSDWVDERLRDIVYCASVEELPLGLDWVIETVPEQLELKQNVLARISERSPKYIASNTSSMSLTSLSGSVSDSARFIGLHFFNPVWAIRLLEIILADGTNEHTQKEALVLAERLGKTPIVVKDIPGFATSRLDLISALEAIRMLESGVASAEDIDKAAMLAYGHPVGPLRLSDIVGLDVRLDIAESLFQEYGERYAPPEYLKHMVAQGNLGQKTGQGFYNWSEE